MTATAFDVESLTFSPLSSEKLFIAKIRDYQRITATLYHEPRVEDVVRSVVPWESMSKNAALKVMALKSTDSKPQLDARDLLLVELIDWFKNSFFSWFDKSVCKNSNCPLKGVEMEAIGSGQPSLEDLAFGASRIELYRCASCQNQERFPRYNHPLKLLENRVGRCGEFANTFTCICSVLGFDARLVIDWTDHVWTEIYSDSQSRWVHVDPCEGAIDTPLVYEVGWNKSLSYCIAVSKYEIQDVTWRYTLKEPQKLFNRRKDCQESWLTFFVLKMNVELQKSLTADQRRQLAIRSVTELVQFLWTPWKETNLSEKDLQGRQSGSQAWKRARNEIGNLSISGYTFVAKEEDFVNGSLSRLTFNAVTDVYSMNGKPIKTGWREGVFELNNINKKIEHDWKMVYLARSEGSSADSLGLISWRLDLTEVSDWSSITILLNGLTYDDANIDLSLSVESMPSKQFPLKLNQESLIRKDEVKQSAGQVPQVMMIRAKLTGGSLGGNLAWQKAQLFRQSLLQESDKDSLVIKINKSCD